MDLRGVDFIATQDRNGAMHPPHRRLFGGNTECMAKLRWLFTTMQDMQNAIGRAKSVSGKLLLL